MKTIWLLQRHSYSGKSFRRAYINRMNAVDAMHRDMNKEEGSLYKQGIKKSRNVRGDDKGVLYTSDGKVVSEWNLIKCELNEEPEPFIGPEEDKLHLSNYNFSWCYFNPDGNDGNGQYVENNLTANDVLEGVKQGYDKDPDRFFMEWLSQEANQYLWDNDGSDDFLEYDSSFREDPCDLMGTTEETMSALITWAKDVIGSED